MSRPAPYPHQTEANRRAGGKPGFGYIMDMGTGKSRTAIDEISSLYAADEISGVIVIAPAGVYENWVRELGIHLPPDVSEETSIVVWRSGDNAKKRTAASTAALDKSPILHILLMNVEALSSVAPARDLCTQFVKTHRTLVAVDESTCIKNPTANRTKFVVKLGRGARYRRILTGSPGSPEALYSQFEFLGKGLLGHFSFTSYRGEFCVVKEIPAGPGGRMIKVVTGYKNVERLGELMRENAFRVRKEDCLSLPPKVYLRRSVPLTAEQQRVYAAVKTLAMAELSSGAIVSAEAVITQLLRLQQIVVGHVVDESGQLEELPSARDDELLAAVEEAGAAGGVIVWAHFRAALGRAARALRARYGVGSVVEYHGGTPPDERQRAVEAFQSGAVRFFVGNQATAGYGLTLTAARTVIYYSGGYSLEQRLQSEDRAHRIGQQHSVTYVDLVSPGTVEEKVHAALRAGDDVARRIMEDGPRQWLV